MQLDCISIGDAAVDTFLWLKEAEVNCEIDKPNCKLLINYASKSLVDKTQTALGGNSCNNATALARLGKKVAYFGVMGNDSNSQKVKSGMEGEGIDVSLMQNVAGKSCNYATIIIFQGERTELVYHDTHDYSLPDTFPVAPYLYISSVGQNYEGFYGQVCEYARKNNTKLVFNPSSHELRKPVETFEPLLRASYLLVANKEEVEHILGYPRGVSDMKVLLEGWRKFGNKFAVITDGTKGSYCFDGEKYYSLGLFDKFKDQAVQQTGAGDAYAAGFMAAVMDGLSAPEAMRWGTLNAGSVVTKVGAQVGLLHLDEMKEYLSGNSDFQAKEI